MSKGSEKQSSFGDSSSDAVARVDVLMALTHELGEEPEILTELYQLIERNPAARSRYVEAMELRSSLKTILDPQSESAVSVSPFRERNRARKQFAAVISSLAATALIAFVLSRGSSESEQIADDGGRLQQPDGSDASVEENLDSLRPKPRIVCARVDAMSLGMTEDIFASDYLVRESDIIRLGDSPQGWVRFLTQNGATVLLSGPALGQFESPSVFRLEFGQLIAEDRSETGSKLSVRVGERIVSDLGTRFGVAVSDNEQLDVEVFDGAVAVASEDGPGVSRLEYGTAVTWPSDSLEPTIRPISEQPMMDRLNRMLSGVTRTEGDVEFHAVIPDSVAGNSGGNDPVIHVFEEASLLRIDQPIQVSRVFNSNENGELVVTVGSEPPTSTVFGRFPQEQSVRTFLLDFEDASGTRASGFIEFDRPILAVIGDANLLNKTDAIMGRAGVTYPTGDGAKIRGAESDPANAEPAWRDAISVSHGRTRLNVSLIVGHGVDQIRILIAGDAASTPSDSLQTIP